MSYTIKTPPTTPIVRSAGVRATVTARALAEAETATQRFEDAVRWALAEIVGEYATNLPAQEIQRTA
jgi:hypothetical protein